MCCVIKGAQSDNSGILISLFFQRSSTNDLRQLGVGLIIIYKQNTISETSSKPRFKIK